MAINSKNCTIINKVLEENLLYLFAELKPKIKVNSADMYDRIVNTKQGIAYSK